MSAARFPGFLRIIVATEGTSVARWINNRLITRRSRAIACIIVPRYANSCEKPSAECAASFSARFSADLERRSLPIPDRRFSLSARPERGALAFVDSDDVVMLAECVSLRRFVMNRRHVRPCV
jgi:hypothetical protein